jgi:16S rRNA (adenine1518-N6/adenine1519-N6)-dimethyltransferase
MSAKSQLRDLNIRPRKGLGQNFLVSPGVLEHILNAAEVKAEDLVLEIGPGLGVLTRALAGRAEKVVAVEVDPELAANLRGQLRECGNIEIVAGDILELDVAKLMTEGAGTASASATTYKVVANIPYNITSAVIRHLLEARVRPALIVLMVQKEVAQRITAAPDEMSLLAVSVQFYGTPRLVHHVPAGAFYPAPKVDSAILRIEPLAHPRMDEREIEGFFQVVRAGFGQKRKQLRNALTQGLRLPADTVEQGMEKAGIDPERRAQTLGVDEWITLYRALEAVRHGS